MKCIRVTLNAPYIKPSTSHTSGFQSPIPPLAAIKCHVVSYLLPLIISHLLPKYLLHHSEDIYHAHRSKADVAFSFNNRRHVTQEVRDDEMGAGMYRIVKLNKQLQGSLQHIYTDTRKHTHTDTLWILLFFLFFSILFARSLPD